MAERRDALYEIVAEQQPMTVRQVFYRATVRGIGEKTEDGYSKVQRMLADMRRDGELPYDWIADNTRWMRKPRTFGGPEEALRRTVKTYRKALWRDADAYVEIWLEKDALAGVVYDVTNEFDVPLMVSRGYASLSFLHSAAEAMANQDRPCFDLSLRGPRSFRRERRREDRGDAARTRAGSRISLHAGGGDAEPDRNLGPAELPDQAHR